MDRFRPPAGSAYPVGMRVAEPHIERAVQSGAGVFDHDGKRDNVGSIDSGDVAVDRRRGRQIGGVDRAGEPRVRCCRAAEKVTGPTVAGEKLPCVGVLGHSALGHIENRFRQDNLDQCVDDQVGSVRRELVGSNLVGQQQLVGKRLVGDDERGEQVENGRLAAGIVKTGIRNGEAVGGRRGGQRWATGRSGRRTCRLARVSTCRGPEPPR